MAIGIGLRLGVGFSRIVGLAATIVVAAILPVLLTTVDLSTVAVAVATVSTIALAIVTTVVTAASAVVTIMTMAIAAVVISSKGRSAIALVPAAPWGVIASCRGGIIGIVGGLAIESFRLSALLEGSTFRSIRLSRIIASSVTGK